MAQYVSEYDGATIEKLLTTAGRNVQSNVTASGIAFRQVVWEVVPTAYNDVRGVAVHPTDGRLYCVRSLNGTLSATAYAAGGVDASVSSSTLVISGL